MHWKLCSKYELMRTDKWYDHKLERVVENEKVKILWDFNIQCHHQIEGRRADVVVTGKRDRTVCKIIDISVPGDCRM